MNGHKNSLPSICQLAEKLYRAESSLTVESGRWFVEEDQNGRFRDELDANSD